MKYNVYKNADGRLTQKQWVENNQKFQACEFRGVVQGKYQEIEWPHVSLFVYNIAYGETTVTVNLCLQGIRSDGVSDEWSMMDAIIVEEG